MKKKLIIFCAALLLIVGSAANAVITTDTATIIDTETPNTGWLYGSMTYSWTHTWDFDPASLLDFSLVSVDSAALDISAHGVSTDQNENIPVTLDSQSLGNLAKGDGNATLITNFDLAAVLSYLTDESATIEVTIPSGKDIKINTSTLTINYTYEYDDGTTPEPPPDPEPIIPAPGAVLLGSIGVGLVGWLRRRRTL